MSPSIYNATDGPLTVGRAGRVLPAHESDDVETLDGLSDHIETGRIVVAKTTTPDPVEAPPTSSRKRGTTQEA